MCQCRAVSLEHLPRAIVNRDTRGLIKTAAGNADPGLIVGITALAGDAGESRPRVSTSLRPA